MNRARFDQSLIRSHADNLGPEVVAVAVRVMVSDRKTHGPERNRSTNTTSIQRGRYDRCNE